MAKRKAAAEEQAEQMTMEEVEALPRQEAPEQSGEELLRGVIREEIAAYLEQAQPQPQQGAQDAEPDELGNLAQQAGWLEEAVGVDMVEVLRGNEQLLMQVSSGEINMYQAYILHEEQGGGQGAMPAPVRGGARRAAVDIGKLSRDKMREIEEKLGRGERVAID